MQTYQIKNRWADTVIFKGEAESLKDFLEKLTARGANLRDANLGGADLRGADLGGADLRDANLRDANLRDANLGGADLRDANLGGADLRDANLRDANLGGANLGDANLGGADLGDANLRDANLGGADLRDANLGGADLGGADLGGIQPIARIRFGDFQPDPALPRRVAETILSGQGALEMSSVHICQTTHCLGGWAIHLSGPAGYALQAALGWSAAAALLLPSAAHLFYASNKEAMQWVNAQVAPAPERVEPEPASQD